MTGKAAADYQCACGHRLNAHDRLSGPGEPWGGCRVSITPTDPGPLTTCPCTEAWPVEDAEPTELEKMAEAMKYDPSTQRGEDGEWGDGFARNH